MSRLLPHDVTPADRQRGCLWASTFRRPGDEVEKLGTINGAPVINRGVTLDGAADYIDYTLWGQFAGKDPLSYHIIFYPDFAYDEDVNREFFDSSANDYRILKRDSVGAYDLRIDLGGTTIIDIPTATYGALWVQGGRNLLSIASTSGSTNGWLNGTQIVTTDPTAWTPVDITWLAVGGFGGSFDGRIESLKFYNSLLTAEDHDAIWAGGGA